MNSGKDWRAIWAFAGSRHFSVFVLVMSITYVLILAVFTIGFRVEKRWLTILADLWPYRLLYALFFLNLILFGIGWVPAVIRRCQAPELAQRAVSPGRFDQAVEVPGKRFGVEDLRQTLRRRGYRVHGADSGVDLASGTPLLATLFHASKGRYSLVGNLLFHAGFLLLLAGAVTNFLYHFEGTVILAEGDSFTGKQEEYRSILDVKKNRLVLPGSFVGELPGVDFDVEKISAEFWQGRMLFTRLEAQILHRGGRDKAKLSEAARVGNAEVTITGYGYAPRFQLKDKDGAINEEGTVRLNIISPGSEDFFYVPGYPHKIFLSFYPDHAEVNGRIVNKSMNLVNPAYFLRILRGRIPVYAGVVKPGEWVDFDGLSISLPSLTKSVEFHIVRSPGHPFIWTAFVIMVLGLAWRLLFYRKEVALWQDDAGRLWLSGRADYYPKLHAAWLAALAAQFSGAPA